MLYDLASLEGLARVSSFVGLAFALALVSLALQKYVLAKPKETHEPPVLIITILGIAVGSGARAATNASNATVERPVEGQGRGLRKLRVDLPLLSRAQPS